MQVEYVTQPLLAYTHPTGRVLYSIPDGPFGHYKYTVLTDEVIPSEIIARPLFFSVPNTDLNIDKTLSMSKFIASYVTNALRVNCIKCNVVYFTDHVRYYPVDENGSVFILTEDEQANIRLDLTSYIGSIPLYVPTDHCELAPVFNQRDLYNISAKEQRVLPDYEYNSGIPYYSGDILHALSSADVDRRINNIRGRTVDLSDKGYVVTDTLPIGLELVIGEMNKYSTNVISPSHSDHITVPDMYREEDVKMSPRIIGKRLMNSKESTRVTVANPFKSYNSAEWSWTLSRMLTQISSGRLPSIRIKGKWTSTPNTNYNRLRLLLIAREQYTEIYPSSISVYSVRDLTVLPDLSIDIPLISLVDLDVLISAIEHKYSSRYRPNEVEDYDYGGMNLWTHLLEQIYGVNTSD